MEQYDVMRLALVFSIQAEIEGMKAENAQREQYNDSLAYTDDDFQCKAEELRILASKHNHQL